VPLFFVGPRFWDGLQERESPRWPGKPGPYKGAEKPRTELKIGHYKGRTQAGGVKPPKNVKRRTEIL
jgi:hypothetical protein